MKALDLTNQRFTRLLAVSKATPIDFGYAKHSAWNCQCDCGKELIVETQKLRSGHTRSCGCLLVDFCKTTKIKHGHAIGKNETGKTTPEYSSWASAKSRCFNTDSADYPDYGGRGITMCEEWRDNFQAFFDYMGPKPPKTSLGRINNNGNYEPGNCRWETSKQQSNNHRRTIWVDMPDGTKLSLKQFTNICGVKYIHAYHRVKFRGMTPYQAVANLKAQR